MAPSQPTTVSSTSDVDKASTLHSIGPTDSPAASTTNCTGPHNDDFNPSLMTIVSLGVMGLLLPLLPSWAAALPLLYVTVFTRLWFYLHGGKLTRKARFFIDERNLLEISDGCDFGMKLGKDCYTPFSKNVPEPTKAGPSSILEALLYDQKDLDLQEWYVQHYGGVWTKSQKNWNERQQRKKEKQEVGEIKTAKER